MLLFTKIDELGFGKNLSLNGFTKYSKVVEWKFIIYYIEPILMNIKSRINLCIK